jgi:hypothetical protein
MTSPTNVRDAAEEVVKRASAALTKHQNTREFKALVRKRVLEMGRRDTELLAPQKRVVADTSRLRTLCCSRRAGKSEVLARLITDALLECHHNEWVVFGARTLGIAKDIIWADLESINNRYCLGWSINNSDLSITTLSGGRFRLFGVDDRKSVEKVRGKKYRLVICDEASTYQEHLQLLVEQAFDPGTKDLKGKVILSGTPGYVKVGYWYQASQGKLPGWSNHHWTIADNVYIPDVAEALADTRRMFGWDEQHPTYLCEYLGLWVDNSSLLVCDYDDARNAVHELPAGYSKAGWRHVIAVDYGYNDACAWLVLAVDPYSDERVVVKYYAESELKGDRPVEIMRELVEEFETTYAVSDPSGGGKGFFETFNDKYGREMGCIIRAANKTDLLGSIRLLNAELRMSRLKFYMPEAAGAVQEIRQLLWKDERRDRVLDNPPFKIEALDCARYATLEALSWRARDKPEGKTPEQIAAEAARLARAKRQERRNSSSWFDRR